MNRTEIFYLKLRILFYPFLLLKSRISWFLYVLQTKIRFTIRYTCHGFYMAFLQLKLAMIEIKYKWLEDDWKL